MGFLGNKLKKKVKDRMAEKNPRTKPDGNQGGGRGGSAVQIADVIAERKRRQEESLKY